MKIVLTLSPIHMFRNTRLGPAPPPPVNNGGQPQQRRTARPDNRQQIIQWWQEVELPKGSGFEDEVALPWFHGKYAFKSIRFNDLFDIFAYPPVNGLCTTRHRSLPDW